MLLREIIDEILNIKNPIDLDARNDLKPIEEGSVANLSLNKASTEFNIPSENIFLIEIIPSVVSEDLRTDDDLEVFRSAYVPEVLDFLQRENLYAWYKSSADGKSWYFAIHNQNNEVDAMTILRLSDHIQPDVDLAAKDIVMKPWEFVINKTNFDSLSKALNFLYK